MRFPLGLSVKSEVETLPWNFDIFGDRLSKLAALQLACAMTCEGGMPDWSTWKTAKQLVGHVMFPGIDHICCGKITLFPGFGGSYFELTTLHSSTKGLCICLHSAKAS